MWLKSIYNKHRQDDGSVAFEYALSTFLLISFLIAFVTLLDVFIAYNKSQKAIATIASLAARYEVIENDDKLEQFHQIYNTIAKADADETSVRILVVRNQGNRLVTRWDYSSNSDDAVLATGDDLQDVGDDAYDNIPNISDGDEIVYIEATRFFAPALSNYFSDGINYSCLLYTSPSPRDA